MRLPGEFRLIGPHPLPEGKEEQEHSRGEEDVSNAGNAGNAGNACAGVGAGQDQHNDHHNEPVNPLALVNSR